MKYTVVPINGGVGGGYVAVANAPFVFPFLTDLATTMSQATADTVHTETLPGAHDHVQDRPTAVGPGRDTCRVLGLLSSPPFR